MVKFILPFYLCTDHSIHPNSMTLDRFVCVPSLSDFLVSKFKEEGTCYNPRQLYQSQSLCAHLSDESQQYHASQNRNWKPYPSLPLPSWVVKGTKSDSHTVLLLYQQRSIKQMRWNTNCKYNNWRTPGNGIAMKTEDSCPALSSYKTNHIILAMVSGIQQRNN